MHLKPVTRYTIYINLVHLLYQSFFILPFPITLSIDFYFILLHSDYKHFNVATNRTLFNINETIKKIKHYKYKEKC